MTAAAPRCRIIPERGSWIELEVTKKDVLAMRIDQSAKIAATIFLRALDEDFGSTEEILKSFYDVTEIKVTDLRPEQDSAEPILNEEGEELWCVGEPIGDADRGHPSPHQEDSRGQRSQPTR